MKSQTLEPQSPPPPFHLAVTKIAVAQICQSVGFKSSQNSALQTLTDIAARYLQSLAVYAAASANSTGRTESNLFDIVAGLERLHSAIGFPGGADVNLKFYESGPILDIMKFVNCSEEIPFAKALTGRHRFEKKEKGVILGSGVERGKNGRNYIPKWLPGIPEMGGKEERKGTEFGFGGNSGEVRKEAGGKWGEERKGKVERGLPLKRAKVRFKLGEGKREGMGFGVDTRNGICKGGKRVSVQTYDDDDENKKKSKKSCSSNRPK